MSQENKRITFTTPKDAAKFSVEDQGEGKLPKLSGYAIVWNQLSDDRGGYRVRLLPNSAQATDVCFALCNHDFTEPMGRTDKGTLTYAADNHGVKVTIDPPETSYARDMISLVRRGDVEGMSFGMLYDGSSFSDKSENGTTIREYSAFQFDEVSITAIPAFTNTTIESEFAQAQKPAATPLRNKMGVELEEIRFQYIRG